MGGGRERGRGAQRKPRPGSLEPGQQDLVGRYLPGRQLNSHSFDIAGPGVDPIKREKHFRLALPHLPTSALRLLSSSSSSSSLAFLPLPARLPLPLPKRSKSSAAGSPSTRRIRTCSGRGRKAGGRGPSSSSTRFSKTTGSAAGHDHRRPGCSARGLEPVHGAAWTARAG